VRRIAGTLAAFVLVTGTQLLTRRADVTAAPDRLTGWSAPCGPGPATVRRRTDGDPHTAAGPDASARRADPGAVPAADAESGGGACPRGGPVRSAAPGGGAPGTVADSLRSRSRKPVGAASLLSAPVPAACGHKAGRLRGGRLTGIPAGHGSMELAWIDGGHRGDLLALGDLDGDGIGDAAATLECDAGGVPWPELIAFYTPGPTLLGAVGLGGVNAPGREPGENATVHRLRYADRAVTAEWSTQEDGDPAAEANLDYTAVLRWNGHRITVSRLTATTERGTVDRFLTDLRHSDTAAARKLAAPGVAAKAAGQFHSHPDALRATPVCSGENAPGVPNRVAGSRRFQHADRVCLLPTSVGGAHHVALAMQKTGFRTWRVSDVAVV
jgi:hypothetical protein